MWFTLPVMCDSNKFPLTVEPPFIPKTRVLEPNHGVHIFMLPSGTNVAKVTLESGYRSRRYETGKELVKSLWSLTCMRQQTHINTHFLMFLWGGPSHYR